MQRLNELATITTGVTIKSQIDLIPDGVRVVQMKDLDKHHELDASQLAGIELKSTSYSQLLAEGDVLFRSRGLTNTSVCFKGEVDAILAAPLLRLQVKVLELLPEYLSWFINQPQSQHWLKSHAEGSGVKMISKKTLEMMPIEVPPLELQEKIVRIHALSMKEQKLMSKIKEKRKKVISETLGKWASNADQLATLINR
jgi:Type I restriction modification DNA specificity domain